MTAATGPDTDSENLVVLRQAAESQDWEAACRLGLVLIEQGQHSEGRRWVEKAARGGGHDAAFHMGRLYDGDGSWEAAKRCYTPAALAGHHASAAILGIAQYSETWYHQFSNRDEINDTPGEEDAWWAAARVGIAEPPEAARKLGDLLGWDRRTVEAEFQLRTAYHAGDATAGYQLGILLDARGWSTQARELFEAPDIWSKLTDASPGGLAGLARRAEDGDADAALLVGMRETANTEREYVNRRSAIRTQEAARHSFEASINRAARYLRLAAHAGKAHAAYRLAQLSLTFKWRFKGLIIDDHDLWYRRAAEAGHPQACAQVAVTRLIHKDPATAMNLCHKAAPAGNFQAAGMLRWMERNWNDVPYILQLWSYRDSGRDLSRDTLVAEIIYAWEELSSLAPDKAQLVAHLTQQYTQSSDERGEDPRRVQQDVAHLHATRNRCAHPAKLGMPSNADIYYALTTAWRLLRSLTLVVWEGDLPEPLRNPRRPGTVGASS